jgi:hypothetical protein
MDLYPAAVQTLSIAVAPFLIGQNQTVWCNSKWCLLAVQTLGVAAVPLLNADFIAQPRKISSLDVPLYRPHAHGHLMKLAKVRKEAEKENGKRRLWQAVG